MSFLKRSEKQVVETSRTVPPNYTGAHPVLAFKPTAEESGNDHLSKKKKIEMNDTGLTKSKGVSSEIVEKMLNDMHVKMDLFESQISQLQQENSEQQQEISALKASNGTSVDDTIEIHTDSPTSRSTSYLFEMYDEGKTFTRKDGYSDVDVEYDEKLFPGMILIPEIDLEIDFFYGTIDEFNNVYNISDNVNLEDLNVCLPRTDNNDILKMEEYLEDEWIFSNFSTYFHSTKVPEEVAEFVKKNLKETQIKIVVGLEEGKIVIDKVSDGQWKVWQKRRRKQKADNQ